MHLCVYLAESDSCRVIITPLSHRLQVFLWLLLKWLFQELFYGLNHQMSHYHLALFSLIGRKWQYKNTQGVRMVWFIVLTLSRFWELTTNLGTVLQIYIPQLADYLKVNTTHERNCFHVLEWHRALVVTDCIHHQQTGLQISHNKEKVHSLFF